MPDDFDPYYTWLGIPAAEQPADHYRLLGINRFEENREAIAHAYNQRMTHIRSFQNGPRAAHSQRVLNDLTKAYGCLLNARRKALYDQHLRSSENAQRSQAAVWPPERADEQMAEINVAARGGRSVKGKAVGHGLRWQMLATGAGMAAVTLTALGIVASRRDRVAVAPNSPSKTSGGLLASGQVPVTPPSPQNPTEATSGGSDGTPVSPAPSGNPSTEKSRTTADGSTASSEVAIPGSPGALPERARKTRGSARPPKYGLGFRTKQHVELRETRGRLDFRRPFTVELWARFAAGSNAHWLFGDLVFGGTHPEVPAGTVSGWQMWIMKTENGKQQFAVSTTKGFLGEFVEKPGEWRHLAVCRDAARITLFVDGRAAASQPVDAVAAGWTPSPMNLHVGGHPYLHASQPTGFHGDLRALRVSTVCRYQANFDPLTVLDVDEETLVALDFSEASTETVADLSGFGYHGRSLGTEWVSLDPGPAVTAEDPVPEVAPLVARAERVPVPAGDDLKAAREQVQKLLGKDLAAAVDELPKEALARKLFDLARDQKDDPAALYVLLEEARSLAAEAANVPLASDIARLAAERFEVTLAELQLSSLKRAGEGSKTPANRLRIAKAGLDLVDEFARLGDFDRAAQAAQIAAAVAGRLRDPDLTKSIRDRREDLVPQKKRWQVAHEAKASLESSPDDPRLNQLWGLFVGVQQGDWNAALPFLAKAELEALKAAAQMELDLPSAGPDPQVAVADRWWEAAQTAERRDRSALLAHALEWYQKAAPTSKGLSKIHIERRVSEIEQSVPRTPLAGNRPRTAGSSSAMAVPPAEYHGLLGRVQVDNRDVGVLWKYGAGLRLADSQVVTILSQVAAPRGNLIMDFVGYVHVPQTSTVTIRHSSSTINGGPHTLYVDGKKLGEVGGPNRPRDDLYKLELGAGEHTVRWTLSGVEIGNSSLQFTDGTTNQPLIAYHNPQLLNQVREIPFRARLNVEMNK